MAHPHDGGHLARGDAGDLGGERGGEHADGLAGADEVERAGHHHVQAEGRVEAQGHQLDRGLRDAVEGRGPQRRRFGDGESLRGDVAVDRRAADHEHARAGRVGAHRLEQVVGGDRVAAQPLRRSAPGRVRRCPGGEVEDEVRAALGHGARDRLAVEEVGPHRRRPRRGVSPAVERPRGAAFLPEQRGEVAAHEARAAGDEGAHAQRSLSPGRNSARWAAKSSAARWWSSIRPMSSQ